VQYLLDTISYIKRLLCFLPSVGMRRVRAFKAAGGLRGAEGPGAVKGEQA